MIPLYSDVCPVHPGDEIVVSHEHGIDGIPVGAEMPAIPYLDGLTLGERDVESQVDNYLPEQFLFNPHLQIQRRLWLLTCKDNMSCALCQEIIVFVTNPKFLIHGQITL